MKENGNGHTSSPEDDDPTTPRSAQHPTQPPAAGSYAETVAWFEELRESMAIHGVETRNRLDSIKVSVDEIGVRLENIEPVVEGTAQLVMRAVEREGTLWARLETVDVDAARAARRLARVEVALGVASDDTDAPPPDVRGKLDTYREEQIAAQLRDEQLSRQLGQHGEEVTAVRALARGADEKATEATKLNTTAVQHLGAIAKYLAFIVGGLATMTGVYEWLKALLGGPG